MARSEEVFPNPTVRKVIFQVRFPNLFAMESLVGNYQAKIMAQFPVSQLLVQRSILFASVATQADEQSDGPRVMHGGPEGPTTGKIWRFSTEGEQEVVLNLTNDSLDISSVAHKAYETKPEGGGFRDRIKHAVDNFLAVTRIPLFLRVGLRYEDDGPLPGVPDGKEFKKYYNSTFPLNRFRWEDADELFFKARVRRGDHCMLYSESLKYVEENDKEKGRWQYVLDYDGYAKRVPASDYLPMTDKLHRLIATEYKKSIKEPVRKWMRRTDHPGRQQ